jgi:hypothetical protein
MIYLPIFHKLYRLEAPSEITVKLITSLMRVRLISTTRQGRYFSLMFGRLGVGPASDPCSTIRRCSRRTKHSGGTE